jgi:hypothetical protein
MELVVAPNNALEPTAVEPFTLMSTDSITSPSSAMLLSAAVAQLGRSASAVLEALFLLCGLQFRARKTERSGFEIGFGGVRVDDVAGEFSFS